MAKDTGVVKIHGKWYEPKAGLRYLVTEDGQMFKEVAAKKRSKGYKLHAFGRGNLEYIHRLVCRLWNGEPEEGQEVRHLDGDKMNNHRTNLAWGSRVENMKDTRVHGSKHHKLSAIDVAQIRAFARIKPYGYRPIMAEKFGVSVACIADAAKGRTWV
jgi:hypothetical protein